MPLGSLSPLFAVHISDGVLQSWWLAGGFVVAGVFALIGCRRIRDEEVPQIALLTAAFFVASSIHLRVGPTSWHLLFNGLVGVMLGWRAALAFPIGLALQYFLLMHGGFYTLGVNTCIMLLPALLAAGLFSSLRNAAWLRRPWCRSALIGACTAIWVLSSVYSVALLVTNSLSTTRTPELGAANAAVLHPITLVSALLCACLWGWLERRIQAAPEFALGLVIGEITVLATITLNCVVLLVGGEANWTLTALALLVLHLPIAALEGVVVGFLVGFLARVKPELLGWPSVSWSNGKLLEGFSYDSRLKTAEALRSANLGPDFDNTESSGATSALRPVSSAGGQPGEDRELLQRG